MRVLMLSSLWPPHTLGGAERYAASLAARLRDAGHEVGALTFGVHGTDVVATVTPWPYRLDAFDSQPRPRRLVFHALDLWRPGVARVLRGTLRDFAPDVVHSHSVQGLSAVALAEPARHGVGHVHTLHDYWLLCQRASLMRADGARCERRCRTCVLVGAWRGLQLRRHHPHVVLAVSGAVAARHRALGWMQGRIRVVHNPVAAPAVPPATPSSQVGTGPRFVYLGRLDVHKGVSVLLEAFRAAAIPEATLRLAGTGPLAATLRAAARDLVGVEWCGALDEPARDALLADADCIVVPSRWEDPAPLVVNEARAAGVAVIGTRVGGIPELVPAAQQALLVPPDDPVALAGAMRAFAADPLRYREPPDQAPPGWPDHLEAVLGAYRDAAAQACSGVAAPARPGGSGHAR